MSTNDCQRELPLFVCLAQQALRAAVAGVIKEHRRTGQPLVMWKDGAVALVDANTVVSPDESSLPSVHEER